MTIIYNARIVDQNTNKNGAVIIQGKKIKRVIYGTFKSAESVLKAANVGKTKNAAAAGRNSSLAKSSGMTEIDARGLVLAPAFIDMHAHFRYPGQTQKEDLDTALDAALYGGFGTLVLMPNTNPVISSKEAALKINAEAAARKKSKVFQTVSITAGFDGKSIEHLNALDNKTTPVISEDGHDVLNAAVMLEGMKIAAKKKIMVSCHCEDPELAVKARTHRARALELMAKYKIPAWGAIDKAALKKVPKAALEEIVQNIKDANSLLELAEDAATDRNILIAQKAGCHIHLCHVSTVKSIEAARRAKTEEKNYKNGFKITCEITPHHLGLEGTTIPQIFAFVNPPLRTHDDRAALIKALKDGSADCIATDHAPHTAADKAAGAPGFTGLETAYALCNTVLCGKEKFTEQKLSALMSANPARILGLKKGLVAAGYDADLVLVDPKKKWRVDSSQFHSKGKATPLDGKTLTGRVVATIVAGQRIGE
ncbi:MAG: dihydroorotase [Treponema sp.]|nr:dihydroorotase [Treponema sp.]